jgi:hypothetical protein
MPCHKHNSEFVGNFTGKYNRTKLSLAKLNSEFVQVLKDATPTQTHECGKLDIEITQPDPCNKCAHLIVLKYTPYDAAMDYVPTPISLLGTLDCDGNITAAGSVQNEFFSFFGGGSLLDGTSIHKFCIKDCKLEHTVTRNYSNLNGSAEDPNTLMNQYWTAECNHLKKYKKEYDCPCEKKHKKHNKCGCKKYD